MTYPYFKTGLVPTAPSSRAEDVPTLKRSALEDPTSYIPHPDLSHAVNVALILGMPLLVTGEPGTGKTQLASVVAHAHGCPLHKFEVKSTSQARDLFYTYDAISAFKRPGDASQQSFIHYQALGRAIIEAFPLAQVAHLIAASVQARHQGPRRSVVLIDEIDKAPRDFPNDLLNEVERLYFRVAELENAATPGADAGSSEMDQRYRPIIVITSNSEKGLPDPFLRRCIYYDIPFPSQDQMREIVSRRMAGVGVTEPMLIDALDLFYKLRRDSRASNLRKEPSTAELLNWLQVLVHRGAALGGSLKNQKPIVLETLSTLVKNSEDLRDARVVVNDKWS